MADGYLRLQEYTRRQRESRRFSLRRVIHECSTGGLRSGFEHEVCAEAAHLAEKPYDMHQPPIPWFTLREPASARRDVAVSASGGGYLVESEVPAEVVDILRPVSVLAAAGVTVWPNLVGNQTVAQETAAATGYWVNEGQAVTESQPTFSQSALVPRNCGVYVERSRLLNLNSANADAALRNDLLRTTGALIDAGCLNGPGTPQPVGILNISGIGNQSGTSLAWAGVLNMQETCATANADDTALTYVAHPGVRELLQQREVVSGSGRFIWARDEIEGRRAMVSTNVPAGAMLCGDFSRAVLGIWGPGPQIAINPTANFAAGIVGMRIFVHCDIGVKNTAAFCKATSIT